MYTTSKFKNLNNVKFGIQFAHEEIITNKQHTHTRTHVCCIYHVARFNLSILKFIRNPIDVKSNWFSV